MNEQAMRCMLQDEFLEWCHTGRLGAHTWLARLVQPLAGV
jgi:hypothetical protein